MTNTMKKAVCIYKDMIDDGYDASQIMDAMCDGSYLADAGYTDEDIEIIEDVCYIAKKVIAGSK